MKTIIFLLQKEYLQVFRNKTMLPLIFVLPMVQLLILVNAATMDMKNIKLSVLDEDYSTESRQIAQKLEASPFFDVQEYLNNRDEAKDRLNSGKSDVVLILPSLTGRNIERERIAKVQILTNAINAQQAQLGFAYINSVLMDYSNFLNLESGILTTDEKQIQATQNYWFNPELNYKYYMLPGILSILVTLIGMFLAAMNLVREKEMGTIEQINVTPVKKYQFIIGKLVPFWTIGLFELALGLTIGKIIYNIPIDGSLLLLFAFVAIYLVALLGLGLFISTITQTQQQVMFVSFFFMIVFVLMSGVFTSADNMPETGKLFNTINPLFHLIKVMRAVLLKGASFMQLLPEFIAISIYAVVIVPLAVLNYRKTA